MRRPIRPLLIMSLFVVAIIALGLVLAPRFYAAFNANIYLNALILGLTLVGAILIIRQVILLFQEVRWTERLRSRLDALEAQAETLPSLPSTPPKLLAPLATMMSDMLSLIHI